MNLRDNPDGTCNCRPLGKGCFFTDGFDGACDCKCHLPNKDKELREFMECDTCRAKAGSPYLCSGCLHNRHAFELLKMEVQKAREEGRAELLKQIEGFELSRAVGKGAKVDNEWRTEGFNEGAKEYKRLLLSTLTKEGK